jgi:hypothetical protein
VIAILESAGIRVTQLRITDATPWHAEVEDLVAGPDGALKVKQISIHYSPTRLFHRSVERIVISGADVDAAIADSVKFESGGSAPVAAAPFSSIELIDSKIRIGKGNEQVIVPLHGLLSNDSGSYRITAQADLDPKPLKLSAVVHDHDVAGSIESEALETAVVQKLLQAFAFDAPEMTGWAATRIAIAYQNGQGSVMATIRPQAIQFTTKSQNKLNLESGVITFQRLLGSDSGPSVLTMSNLNANSSTSDVFAEGINGTVTIDRFSPFVTPQNQQLTIAKLTSGKVKLYDGALTMHGEPSGEVVIDKTEWQGMGGTVSSEDARVRLDGSADFALVAKDVALHDLLDAFSQGKATGEGRVNATIPFHIRAGQIALGEGTAVAEPGGNIQILEAQSLTDTIASADSSFAAGGANAQLREDLPRAFSDFQFETLRADLRNSDNGLRADIRLAGRGRAQKTRTYDLEFHVSPINEALAIGLGVQRILQGK